ncbi:Rha family transcriptional regulator [Orbus wheelerorum]|uniref:Rha family transcriptional regulator n=1 Tax=Orbus wheelerorum TaxID=3074111 RepID=UPI00370DB201
MNLTKLDFNEMVTLSGNQVITTSLKVATYFAKRHLDVFRTIKRLDCSGEFTERNFSLYHKIASLQNNKPQPFYNMAKDEKKKVGRQQV